MFDSSDESRDEEISLAEARRPYQINLNSDTELIRNNTSKCCGRRNKRKSLIKILIPRIFILVLTTVYVFIIAATFYSVENEKEREELAKYEESIKIIKNNLMAQLHNLSPQIPIERLYQETNEFSNKLLEIGRKRGKRGISSLNKEKQQLNIQQNWTFVNSILFAISLISRIGYGHLVPLTPTGKTLIFPFAIFGIPLFILLVADLAKTFSLLFNWICRISANCWRKFRKRLSPSQAKEIKLNGKNALKKESPKNCCGQKSPIATTCSNKSEKETIKSQNNSQPENESKIFLFFLFLLIWSILSFIYLFLENWNILDCFYFVFVTICSVGFGDFAPNTLISTFFTIFIIIPSFAL
uniref:Potassium channel domain-containing protein n=1 Tax=Meloidogyne enterolobii TaxID=390850 RepID=A0A6V7YA77_MELEN|nr:unnamed protein product [Meloidogyne enterolobii]